MTFPSFEQVTELVNVLDKEMNRKELQEKLGLVHRGRKIMGATSPHL